MADTGGDCVPTEVTAGRKKRKKRRGMRGKGYRKNLVQIPQYAPFALENLAMTGTGYLSGYGQPGPPCKRRRTEYNDRIVSHYPPLERQVDFIQRPRPEVQHGLPGISITIPNGDERPVLKPTTPFSVQSEPIPNIFTKLVMLPELSVTVHYDDWHPVSKQAGPISLPPPTILPTAGPQMVAPAIRTNYGSSFPPAGSWSGTTVRRRKKRRGKKGRKNHIMANNSTMATCTSTSMFQHQTLPSLNLPPSSLPPVSLPPVSLPPLPPLPPLSLPPLPPVSLPPLPPVSLPLSLPPVTEHIDSHTYHRGEFARDYLTQSIPSVPPLVYQETGERMPEQHGHPHLEEAGYPPVGYPRMEEPGVSGYPHVEEQLGYPHVEERFRYPRVEERSRCLHTEQPGPFNPTYSNVEELSTQTQFHEAIRSGSMQCRDGPSLPPRPEFNRELIPIKTEPETEPEPDTNYPGPSPLSHRSSRVVAIDCEMVGCFPDDASLSQWRMRGKKRKPLEVSKAGRCSIVDYHGNVLYDSYIRPNEPITSFRTRYSGITKRHMKNATPIDRARLEILDILRDKIVVAHDINNDLDALSITLPPDVIRDTSFSVPLRLRANLNPFEMTSLKKLARQILGEEIQKGVHSSCVDARVTMSLYRCVEDEWEREMEAKSSRLNSLGWQV